MGSARGDGVSSTRSTHSIDMPLAIAASAPTILLRKSAFERAGLTRQAIDERLRLTPDEFRVEGGLIAIGPIYADAELTTFIEELEGMGFVYFEDFFDLSGTWPSWLTVLAMAREERKPIDGA